MKIIGIDPGIKGGIATITETGAGVISMPTSSVDGKTKINSLAIADYLIGYKITVAIVEEAASRPLQGVVSMFSFGEGYGRILGVLDALKIQTIIVKPQIWKNVVLPGTKKDKAAAIAYCKRQYPNVSLIPLGSKKDSDGIADSICIARFGELFYKSNREKIDARNSAGNKASI